MTTSDIPYPHRPWIFRRLGFFRQRLRVWRDREGGGVFASDQLLPGTPAWGAVGSGLKDPLGHAHLSFLSHTYADRGWWYGATVLTVPQAALEMLEERVEEEVQTFIKERGVSWEEAFTKTVHGDGAISAPAPMLALADARGRPRTGWECYRDAWARVVPTDWEALSLSVGVKRDTSLPGYVGLHAVVDREGIDRDFLVSFVREFWSSGEVECHRPVDWSVHGPGVAEGVAAQVSLYDRMGKPDASS